MDDIVMAERYVDPDARGRMVAELMENGRVTDYQAAVRRNDGKIIWIRYYASLVPGEDSFGFVLSDVTEAHDAVERLAASEELYRSIFGNALVGLGRSTIKDGRVIEANQRMAEIFGYDTPEDLIAGFVATERYVDPSQRAKLVAQLEESGEVAEFETKVRRKDGAVIWTRSFARRRPGKDYMDLVITDITEEKHAAEAQRASEQRFKHFAEIASDWLWETDEEHRFTFLSRPMVPWMHASPEDAQGKTRWELNGVDPDTDEKWRQHREDMDAHRPIKDFVYEHAGPDGRRMYRSVKGEPVFHPGGAFKGYRGVTSNVTKLKEHEQQIADSWSLLNAVFDTMDQGLIAYDADLKILACNRRIPEMLDVPAAMVAPGADFGAIRTSCSKSTSRSHSPRRGSGSIAPCRTDGSSRFAPCRARAAASSRLTST